jgi:hypothetical protein
MRILATCRWCLALLATISLSQASDADELLDGLRFSDGVSRSTADFAGQHVVLYFFCGNCPTALSTLGTDVKQAVDWIEQERKPAWFVCITPDELPANLIGLAQSKGITNALMAHDPRNRLKISTKNILQSRQIAPDGTLVRAPGNTPKDMLTAAMAQASGSCRIPVEGLTDAKVITAWWMVERGVGKGVLKELVAVGKRKGATAEQAQKVVEAAQKACDSAFAAAGDGLAAYETIERLASRFEGLDLKPLKTRLGELDKDATVKEELKAREMWQKCQAALASPKPKEQAAGRDGLAQLAKKFPDTVYGRKAANEPPPVAP